MSTFQKASLFNMTNTKSCRGISIAVMVGFHCLLLGNPLTNKAQEQFIKQIGEDYANRPYYNALVIGVVKGDSTSIHTFGKVRPKEPGKPNKNHYFEIGSLTKVFTTTIFQDLVNKGELDPQAPVNKFLPDNINLSAKGSDTIRLHHLATHTAGLPRVDKDYFYKRSKDIFKVGANPYKNYGKQKLYEFLDEVIPFAKPGEQLHYSNMGMALLGHIMELETGKPYDSLIAEYTSQIGLENTTVNLKRSVKKRNLLPAFNRRQREVPYWDFKVMEPMGALKSTPKDMLRFLQVSMGKVETPLTSIIKDARQVRDTGNLEHMDNVAVGYGWFQGPKTIRGEKATWHNGQTGGFSSFIAFLPEQEQGVVALANTNGGLGEIAFKTLEILNKD